MATPTPVFTVAELIAQLETYPPDMLTSITDVRREVDLVEFSMALNVIRPRDVRLAAALNAACHGEEAAEEIRRRFYDDAVRLHREGRKAA